MLKKIVLVFLGGAVGAAIREMFVIFGSNLHGDFPSAILAANLISAFLIGLIAALSSANGPVGADAQLFLATGVMGGLSTISTLIWSTYVLAGRSDRAFLGISYLAISLVAGLGPVGLGAVAGRTLRGSRAD